MIFKSDLTKAAKIAGKIILDGYEKAKKPKYKDELKSILTETDLRAEKAIIAYIQRKYPKHGIFSEEKGSIQKQSSYLWVIDPLDGTANFAQNIPFFCISIAILINNQPEEGIIYDPLHKMIFYARWKNGAYFNGKKINVSKKKLSEALCGFGFGNLKTGIKIFTKIINAIRKPRILGSTGLALAYVANGFIDAYIVNYISKWDIAAGYLLVLEAGGKVSDFNGNKIDFAKNKGNIIAANKEAHTQILNVIKK